MKTRKSLKRRIITNLRRTWKNKAMAILGIVVGIVSAIVAEGDITALVILALISLPLFFAKEDWTTIQK